MITASFKMMDQTMVFRISFIFARTMSYGSIFLFIKPLLVIHTPLFLPPPATAWSAFCHVLVKPFEESHYSVRDLKHVLFSPRLSSLPPSPSLQVFQRFCLSNGNERAALGELLRWRQVQCEGRGDWKHRPPQSPPLPPTLLWTNRKASP